MLVEITVDLWVDPTTVTAISRVTNATNDGKPYTRVEVGQESWRVYSATPGEVAGKVNRALVDKMDVNPYSLRARAEPGSD